MDPSKFHRANVIFDFTFKIHAYQAFLKILYDIWYINKCNVQNIL